MCANAQGRVFAHLAPRTVAAALLLCHGDHARAATSRSRHGKPRRAPYALATHTRTHALEFAPDQEGAARDPGVADKWAGAVNRRGEKKKKKGDAPDLDQEAQEEEEPGVSFGTLTRFPFPFFSFS
jgi:hypothetical protein